MAAAMRADSIWNWTVSAASLVMALAPTVAAADDPARLHAAGTAVAPMREAMAASDMPAQAFPAPAGSLVVVRPEGQSTLISPAALGALPRQTVTTTDHDKPARFTGTDLREVLRAAGAELPERIRGALMRRVILVQGADGYAVVFAFAELDPSLGDRQVFVVDRVDDKPLPANDGPWRLVVPRDARGGRWVRQVVRISVLQLP